MTKALQVTAAGWLIIALGHTVRACWKLMILSYHCSYIPRRGSKNPWEG